MHSKLGSTAVSTLFVMAMLAADAGAAPTAPDAATRARVSEAYGRLPLRFEANRGQTDARVKFLSRGPGYSVFLTSTEAVLVVSGRGPGDAGEGKSATALRMTLLDANPEPRVTGKGELPGAVNYFVGKDPSQWRRGIPTYAGVVYREVYPGVDLVYYGNQRQLEYDFVVRAGADPGKIALDFAGADRIEIDSQGDLVLHTAAGELRQRKPLVYQEVDGMRREIAGGYAMTGPRQVGFQLARYDESLPLVIDPVFVYSTYLGGSGISGASGTDDAGNAIAVDSLGNAYVTGFTTSADFPKTPGAFDTTIGGSSDAFVTKLNPSGTALVYSTYLGGSSADQGTSIAVDIAGNAYVTGLTQSANFPATPGAFDTTINGGVDAFAAKLDATGATLSYATYLGGAGDDRGFGIAVDIVGNAYVTGITRSANFPITPGALDTTLGGGVDAFVTKLDAMGGTLVHSTFLGGNGFDQGLAIAADSFGNAYVTGQTNSADFPTTPTAFDTTLNGGLDAFVTKLDAMGATLAYSTYLGGSGSDLGAGIALDVAGNAYVTGNTGSANFPTTPGAFGTTINGGGDAFVTKLDSAGATLAYSTYFGGSGNEGGRGIAVDIAGSAYVTGDTASVNFPTTPGALDTTHNGGQDAFVTKLDAAGAALLYSTYLGGGAPDVSNGIAVDLEGNAYVTGTANSGDFPTTPGAFDRTRNGNTDAFVVKISDTGPAATLTLTPSAAVNVVGSQHCVTAAVHDAFGNSVSGASVRFSVAGAVNTSGTGTTDASGQAAFCYTGPTAPGADAISAYADANANNTQDAGEPGAAASKTWVLGASATLTLTPSAAINVVGTQHCVTAVASDAFGNLTPGVIVRFSVIGSVGASGSATTEANGQAAFCYTGPTAPGADTITAYADANANNTQDAGEPGAATSKTWVLGASATLTLTPSEATNIVATQHCVTAAASDAFSNPIPGVIVRFSVTGSVGASGSATTEANGQAAFCYTGPAIPGADAIAAYADTNSNNTQDAGEPGAAATKAWLLPAATLGQVTGGGQVPAALGSIAFGFNAKSTDLGVKGNCNVVDRAAGVHIKCLEVSSLVRTGTHATLFGPGTINGTPMIYRIDVEDLGEPGAGRDSFKILTDSGYAAGGVLTGGNIQIHGF